MFRNMIWKIDSYFQSTGNWCYKILLTVWTHTANSVSVSSGQFRGRFPSNFIYDIGSIFGWYAHALKSVTSWDVIPCTARLTSSGLHGVISQKIVFFIVSVSKNLSSNINTQRLARKWNLFLQLSTKWNSKWHTIWEKRIHGDKTHAILQQRRSLLHQYQHVHASRMLGTHTTLQISTTNVFDFQFTTSADCVVTINNHKHWRSMTSYTRRRVFWYRGNNIMEEHTQFTLLMNIYCLENNLFVFK
jgi:hypothetical protein